MEITLRPFLAKDLDLLPAWSKAMGLGDYMSRHRPLDQAAVEHDPAHGLLWFVILVDGYEAGAIWLEPGGVTGQRILGVFLGQKELLGQGIGSRAIRLAVAALRKTDPAAEQVVLNVRESNARAIACYQSCGFQTIGSGLKSLASGGTLAFLRMQLDLTIAASPEMACWGRLGF
jgi:RimJ/RimL family protein N-acetyltransferase